MTMSEIVTIDTTITVVGLVAILAFLWNLHRDMVGLRERMARLEGLLEGYTKRERSTSISD